MVLFKVIIVESEYVVSVLSRLFCTLQTKINPFHGLMLLPKQYGKERKVLVFAEVRGYTV